MQQITKQHQEQNANRPPESMLNGYLESCFRVTTTVVPACFGGGPYPYDPPRC